MTSRIDAVTLESGAILWEKPSEATHLAAAPFLVAPRLQGETLLLARAHRITEGRSLVDGSLRWTLGQGVYAAAPAVMGNLACLFDDVLTAVDEDGGQTLWVGDGLAQ